MRFNARLHTFHHGPPHPFKDARVVADTLIGIHNVTGKCLFIVNRSSIYSPEDSNLVSMEAMQWILLHLSISHDGCY
jgi:hypothetical protein